MNQQALLSSLTAALARIPQWIRHDLATQDPAIRIRAEESLAAMIAAALGGTSEPEGR